MDVGRVSTGEPESAGTTVDADRVVLEEGAATAEGEVVIHLGMETIHADRARLDGDVLTVEGGRWERESGEVLSFDRATVHLDTPGTLEVEGASFTTCGSCPRPPWRVTARRARVVLEEEVTLRGATVRIFEIPLLPVPAATVPLERRSGLLAPEVGWGEDGPRASLPLYLTLGEQADVTLAPEVRVDRGARLLTEARWATRAGTGEVDGVVGYDWTESAWRGATSWDQAAERGLVRAATTGRLVSDPAYLTDYRDDYLSRSWPWTEARALAAAGPLELSWDRIQANPDGVLRDVRAWERWTAGLYRGATDLPGGLLVAGSVEGQLERIPGSEHTIRSRTMVDASRPSWAGPVRLTPRLRGALWTDSDTVRPEPWLEGSAEVEAALPAWRHTKGGLERLEPVVSVVYGLANYHIYETLQVSPGLTWRRTAGEGFAEAGARLRFDPRWNYSRRWWDLDGAVQWRGLRGRAQLTPDVSAWLHQPNAVVEVGWDHGPVSLNAGWIFAENLNLPWPERTDLHQAHGGAAWTLPGRLSTLRVGASASWDLEGGAWVSRVGRVSWTHPTGCARVGVVGRLDADREWPDVGVELGVR